MGIIGIYTVGYSDSIYRYIFAKTQSELIQKLHDKIEMYRDAELSEECSMTLGEWLDKWLYEYVALTIRPHTLNGYELIVRNQIKPNYGGKQPKKSPTLAN